MTRMKKLVAGALALAGVAGGAVLATTPAEARVAIGVGIGVGVPGYYYGPGYYPPGPCGSYDYYYSGYCGYPVYNGGVFIGGRWFYGPHYYRWWGGRPWFWNHGRWAYWGGWRGAHFNWSHRGWGGRGWGGRGWHGGWHGGHAWHGGGVHVGGHIGGVHVGGHIGGGHHR